MKAEEFTWKSLPKAMVMDKRFLSLGNHTGLWRRKMPIIKNPEKVNEKTVYFCPENAIRNVGGKWVIDYRYCKGCGMCAFLDENIEMRDLP